jgi:hypothetical protein
MPFEFGDVVLVPFPFTSRAASKSNWEATRGFRGARRWRGEGRPPHPRPFPGGERECA